MTNHRELAQDILARLGAQPATSFLEDGVARVMREVLETPVSSEVPEATVSLISPVVLPNQKNLPRAVQSSSEHARGGYWLPVVG